MRLTSDKRRNERRVTFGARVMQCGAAVMVLRVHGSIRLQKELDDLKMALHCRNRERRSAIHIACSEARLTLNEPLDQLRMPLARRAYQWRRPFLVRRFKAALTLLEQNARALDLAVFARP